MSDHGTYVVIVAIKRHVSVVFKPTSFLRYQSFPAVETVYKPFDDRVLDRRSLIHTVNCLLDV